MIKGFIKIFIIIFSFFSFLNGKSQETEPVYPIEEETFEEIEYNEED